MAEIRFLIASVATPARRFVRNLRHASQRTGVAGGVAIAAMIFDLDGTLVQTEKLKARSYGLAAAELCEDQLDPGEVAAAFGDVVGLSRRKVAQRLVDQFNLGRKAAALAPTLGVTTAWQAFVQVRLRHYERMLADPDVIIANQWPHNVGLLHIAQEIGCATALATMSRCEQAARILDILDLNFDFVATRDDVSNGKPDPEIYDLVASELDVPARRCLVIEDSPVGVAAAVAAGMKCIAVTTPFTRDRLHGSGLLDERWIVDDPADLIATVRARYSTEDR